MLPSLDKVTLPLPMFNTKFTIVGIYRSFINHNEKWAQIPFQLRLPACDIVEKVGLIRSLYQFYGLSAWSELFRQAETSLLAGRIMLHAKTSFSLAETNSTYLSTYIRYAVTQLVDNLKG